MTKRIHHILIFIVHMVIIWQVAFIAYKMICKIKHKYTSIDILIYKTMHNHRCYFDELLNLILSPLHFQPRATCKITKVGNNNMIKIYNYNSTIYRLSPLQTKFMYSSGSKLSIYIIKALI
jgi:hypothetical protein